MSFSTLYQKPLIINHNYEPLKHKPWPLQYYFSEAFQLMDNEVPPVPLLISLLDKYLSFPRISRNSLRTVDQQAFARQMKAVLEHVSAAEGLVQAIRLINESAETIQPKDDLIVLFSVYFSLFPFAYRELTNLHVKNALTICDINNIYFHTILERWLAYKSELGTLYSNKETILIAYLANQYPSFLKKQMRDLKLEGRRQSILSHGMGALVKYATVDEVENIILMPVMAYLNSDDDQYVILKHSLPYILDKVSDQTLENNILPELLKLLNQKYTAVVSQILLICIKRMSSESLRRSVLPVLQPYFFSESKEDFYDSNKQYAVIKPFLLMLSRLSNDENNKIAEQLIPRLNMDWSNKILAFLKKLRSENFYVNDNLFQTMSERVSQDIDDALSDIKTHGYCPAYPTHLNAQQVKTYFSAFSFEEVYKTHREALLDVLQDFTKLPDDIYPKALRAKVLKFLWGHRAAQASGDKHYVSAIISYLKTHEFTDANSREILLAICDYAIQKIKEGNFDLDLWGMDSQLLATCASLMNEQELQGHIVPMMDVRQIDDENIRYLKAMSPTFKQVFTRMNNTYLPSRFFDSFLICYLRSPYITECKELLPLIIEKLNPVSQVYACRFLLKYDRQGFKLEGVVSVFAWFYKHNSETLGLPGFCNAHLHPSIELSNRIEGWQAESSARAKCSLM